MIIRILFLVLGLIITACQVEEPQLPSWDTQMAVQLPAKKWLMKDLLEPDSVLQSDTTQTGEAIYRFSTSDSSEWHTIDRQQLAIEGVNDHYDASIGVIQVEPGNYTTSDSVNVMDVLPPELTAFGDTLPPYPPFDITPDSDHVAFEDFKQVKIKSGSVWVYFHNNMFLAIRPGMRIEISANSGIDTLIGVIEFPDSIPPNSVVRSSDFDLSGKTITNNLILRYYIPVAGSDTLTILDDSKKQGFFYVDVWMSRLEVEWAEAKIPQQTYSRMDTIALPSEDARLIQAQIDQGQITLTFTNNLPVAANIELQLPDFRKNDAPKVVRQELSPDQVTTVNVDLDGYTIVNHQAPGDFIDQITYSLDAEIPATEDYVAVDVVMDSLYFHALSGELQPIHMDIDSTSINDLDFFEDLEGRIRLEALQLVLEFENQIDFPIQFQMRIAGYHKEQGAITDSVVINIDQQINPVSVSPVTQVVLNSHSTSPSIVDLLEISPTSLVFSGSATVQGQGGVAVGQGIRVKFTLESPLTLKITETIEPTFDTESFEVDSEARRILTEEVQEAFMKINIVNSVPIGVQLDYRLAVDSTLLQDNTVIDSTKKYALHVEIAAAQTDDNGYSIQPSETQVTITLSQQQLQIFNHDSLYFRPHLLIPTTDKAITLRQDDYIKVQAEVKTKYRVKIEDEE